MEVSLSDIVQRVFGEEPDFLAIIVNSLGGNDTITVGETVQKTVWVDAGPGDDTVRIEPQLSYLPDLTDPFGERNDVWQKTVETPGAWDFGIIDTGRVYTGLTIDSARAEEPDIDWYRFEFALPPVPGDRLELTTQSPLAGAQLSFDLYQDAGETPQLITNGAGDRPEHTRRRNVLPAADRIRGKYSHQLRYRLPFGSNT